MGLLNFDETEVVRGTTSSQGVRHCCRTHMRWGGTLERIDRMCTVCRTLCKHWLLWVRFLRKQTLGWRCTGKWSQQQHLRGMRTRDRAEEEVGWWCQLSGGLSQPAPTQEPLELGWSLRAALNWGKGTAGLCALPHTQQRSHGMPWLTLGRQHNWGRQVLEEAQMWTVNSKGGRVLKGWSGQKSSAATTPYCLIHMTILGSSSYHHFFQTRKLSLREVSLSRLHTQDLNRSDCIKNMYTFI